MQEVFSYQLLVQANATIPAMLVSYHFHLIVPVTLSVNKSQCVSSPVVSTNKIYFIDVSSIINMIKKLNLHAFQNNTYFRNCPLQRDFRTHSDIYPDYWNAQRMSHHSYTAQYHTHLNLWTLVLADIHNWSAMHQLLPGTCLELQLHTCYSCRLFSNLCDSHQSSEPQSIHSPCLERGACIWWPLRKDPVHRMSSRNSQTLHWAVGRRRIFSL